jgi:hypothetical protein
MLHKSRKQPVHGSAMGYFLVHGHSVGTKTTTTTTTTTTRGVDGDDTPNDTRVVIPFEVQEGYCSATTELTVPAQMPVQLVKTNPEKWDEFQRKLNKVTVTAPYFPNWWVVILLNLIYLWMSYRISIDIFDYITPNDFGEHMDLDQCRLFGEWGSFEYEDAYTKNYCDAVKLWKWGQVGFFLLLVIALLWYEANRCRKQMDAWKTLNEPKLEAACRDFSPEAEANDGYFVEYQNFTIQLRSVVSDGAGRGGGSEMVL